MVQIIPDIQRFLFENDWLKTRWHFSFADYYDPENMSFGPLRVFNDDVVQPGGGFPMHPHGEMEIVTYILEGELEHRDSAGGHGVLQAGDVQHMTAGRGIRHSEFNPSATKPVHLLQIWIAPNQPRLAPGYEQAHVDVHAGQLTPIVAGKASNGTLHMHQDATIYVGRFAGGEHITHALPSHRRAYVFVIRGDIVVNGQTLHAGDQARISGEVAAELAPSTAAELLLIDLP